jgi:hypothetical protein
MCPSRQLREACGAFALKLEAALMLTCVCVAGNF